MESRKMVLMNLFAGQEWRCRCREWTCRHSGGKRVGWLERVALKQIQTMYKIDSGKLLHNTGNSTWCSVTF